MEVSRNKNKQQYIFYAEVQKGYILKILFDVLGETFNRLEINITKKGIIFSRSDQKFSICYSVYLDRDGFKGYRVLEDEMNVSFDLSCLKKLLKNVKKKERIIMKMYDYNTLYFEIKSSNSGGTPKSEEISIKIQKVDCVSNEGKVEPPTEGCYFESIDIDSSDFQKIKKMQGGHDQNGSIRIVMQESNYLSISDADETYSTKLTFGDTELDLYNYDRNFDKGLFKRLAKISNLSQQIQFCCPRKEYQQYPLLIKTKIDSMGFLKIYLKDEDQLEEESKYKFEDIS